MHPLEHLYYFSCLGPSFLVYTTPFAFMWNGVHLLISPAASHSGWEDHFQSDQYHYLHHRWGQSPACKSEITHYPTISLGFRDNSISDSNNHL